MKCAYCKYNDGVVYTSHPPKYRCSVTGEYHLALDDCNVEFAPVVRCKDCKRYTPFRNIKGGEMDEGECEGYDPCVPANHFCSRGERRMTPKTITSIVVVFRINGVKYGRRMNFDTEVAEEHIGFTKTVLETLMRGMKTQAVIDDYKVYDEVRVLDEVENG